MSDVAEPFTWGQGGTKESLSARRKVAQALMAKGADYSPVGHWTQGLARVADAMVGAWQNKELDDLEKAGIGEQAGRNAILSGAEPTTLGGGTPAPAATAASPAPDGASAAAPASFGEVAPRLKADLARDFNLAPEQAAGVVGPLAHESGGFSTLQEIKPVIPGSRGGFGYAQWTGPRRRQFESWTAQNGLDPTSYEANYGFLKHELSNTGEGKVLDAVRATRDPAQAATAFTNGFLRPGIPAMGSRQKWTQRALTAANEADMPAPGAMQAEGPTGQPGFAIPQGARAVESIPGDDPAQLRAEAQAYAQTNPEAARQMLARADAAEASTPPAPMPPARPADLAMAPPAAPGMTAQTFDAVQGGQPLAPAFQAEGAAQPWMGTAIPPQQPAMVAQAPAQMPPQRPADLPAPGASEAIGQMPPPAALQSPQAAPQAPQMMQDLSNSPDGGMRQLQVASEEQRLGLPSGANAVSPIDRIVQALMGNGAQSQPAGTTNARRVATALQGSELAAPAASTGAAKVAAAVTGQPSAALPAPSAALAGPTTAQPANARLQAAYATLNSPYARPGERALAQGIIQQSLKSAEFETVTRPDGSVYRVPKAGGAPVQVFGPQSKPDGPTGDMREYDLHVAQEKAAGRQPESFTAWARGNKSAGATAVNIDTKGAGKFVEKANEIQAKRYGEMVDGSDGARQMQGDLDMLEGISKGISTGRGAEARLAMAQFAKAWGFDDIAAGITGGKLPEMEAFSSLIDKLTPQMRQGMPGAASDRDVSIFRNALPSMIKTPEGNQIVMQTLRAMNDYKMRAGDLAGQALRGEISQADADKGIRAMELPFAKFKEYRAAQDKAGGQGGTNAAPAASAPPPEARKSIGGKSYVKRGTEWFEE